MADGILLLYWCAWNVGTDLVSKVPTGTADCCRFNWDSFPVIPPSTLLTDENADRQARNPLLLGEERPVLKELLQQKIIKMATASTWPLALLLTLRTFQQKRSSLWFWFLQLRKLKLRKRLSFPAMEVRTHFDLSASGHSWHYKACQTGPAESGEH